MKVIDSSLPKVILLCATLICQIPKSDLYFTSTLQVICFINIASLGCLPALFFGLQVILFLYTRMHKPSLFQIYALVASPHSTSQYSEMS